MSRPVCPDCGNASGEGGEEWRVVDCWTCALRAERDRYREALEAIVEWSQHLQDDVKTHGDGIAMWRGCVATAAKALEGK